MRFVIRMYPQISSCDVHSFSCTSDIQTIFHGTFSAIFGAAAVACVLKPIDLCRCKRNQTETMRNNDPTDYYYLDNVPWTMYFDKARALHGAYWRTRFGYPQSHGCVNLSVGDAHWLFNWAHEGDYVYVHDSSGLTPTDPALYHDWAY